MYSYGAPQRMQNFESAACWSDGRATRGSSSPKSRSVVDAARTVSLMGARSHFRPAAPRGEAYGRCPGWAALV